MNILFDIIAGIVIIGLFVLSAQLFRSAIWVAFQDPEEWKEQQKKFKEKTDEQTD